MNEFAVLRIIPISFPMSTLQYLTLTSYIHFRAVNIFKLQTSTKSFPNPQKELFSLASVKNKHMTCTYKVTELWVLWFWIMGSRVVYCIETNLSFLIVIDVCWLYLKWRIIVAEKISYFFGLRMIALCVTNGKYMCLI